MLAEQGDKKCLASQCHRRPFFYYYEINLMGNFVWVWGIQCITLVHLHIVILLPIQWCVSYHVIIVQYYSLCLLYWASDLHGVFVTCYNFVFPHPGNQHFIVFSKFNFFRFHLYVRAGLPVWWLLAAGGEESFCLDFVSQMFSFALVFALYFADGLVPKRCTGLCSYRFTAL